MARGVSPITWSNVAAPTGGAALNAFNQSGQNLGNAISGIGDFIKQGADDYATSETDTFIAELNAMGSDAERNNAVQAASQAFLKMGDVNNAVTDAQNQDFLVNQEGRSAAMHLDDLKTNVLERTGLQQDIDYNTDANPDRLLKLKQDLKLATNEDERATILSDIRVEENNNAQTDRKLNKPLRDLTRKNNVTGQNLIEAGNTEKVNQVVVNRVHEAQLDKIVNFTGSAQEKQQLLTLFQEGIGTDVLGPKNQAILTKLTAKALKDTVMPVQNMLDVIQAQNADAGNGIDGYSSQVKDTLTRQLTEQIAAANTNATPKQIDNKVLSELKKIDGLNAQFASRKLVEDIKTERTAIRAKTVLDKERKDADNTLAMYNNPKVHLKSEVLKMFKRENVDTDLTPLAVNEVVTGVYDKISKALNVANMNDANKRVALLAINDLVSGFSVDKDRTLGDMDDLVIAGTTTDASDLDPNELLDYLSEYITPNVSGNAVRTQIQQAIAELTGADTPK